MASGCYFSQSPCSISFKGFIFADLQAKPCIFDAFGKWCRDVIFLNLHGRSPSEGFIFADLQAKPCIFDEVGKWHRDVIFRNLRGQFHPLGFIFEFEEARGQERVPSVTITIGSLLHARRIQSRAQ